MMSGKIKFENDGTLQLFTLFFKASVHVGITLIFKTDALFCISHTNIDNLIEIKLYKSGKIHYNHVYNLVTSLLKNFEYQKVLSDAHN